MNILNFIYTSCLLASREKNTDGNSEPLLQTKNLAMHAPDSNIVM